MNVVIIDYGSGNLHSAQKAFEKAAHASDIHSNIIVTNDPEKIGAADRIVLPGVGAFADCMSGLLHSDGLIEALEFGVRRKGRPFLGICVGMQLMAEQGFEHGIHKGLGWMHGNVRAIKPNSPNLKIPHMGWNTLNMKRSHPLLAGIHTGPTGLHAYFVHSFQFVPSMPEDCIADCDYGEPVVAMVGNDNMAGTQFHPEKSQNLGLSLIANFLGWAP